MVSVSAELIIYLIQITWHLVFNAPSDPIFKLEMFGACLGAYSGWIYNSVFAYGHVSSHFSQHVCVAAVLQYAYVIFKHIG